MRQQALALAQARACRLSNYWPGENAAALAHLHSVLQAAPARSADSLYLWGPTGCGKTHLLRALRAQAQANGALLGWMDASSPAQAFDPAWPAVCIDDAHRLDDAAQAQAFAWYALAQANDRPVWAAGALPPVDLPLREDLRTRLGSARVLGLQPLDEAQRRRVLSDEARTRGLSLGADVIDYLCTHFSRDLGSLMGWLDALDRYAWQSRRAPTLPMLRAMLAQPDAGPAADPH